MRLSMRSRTSKVLVAMAGLVLVAAGVFVFVQLSTKDGPADTALRGWPVDVNGHELYIQCQGTGSPAVILDAGLGDTYPVWDDTFIGTENLGVRVCAYDRWGLGRSGDYPGQTRPIAEAATDLHALLAAADVPPPYVLVSHSIAGLIHRYYTKLYQSEVAGLVLLDTAPDDWDTYMKTNAFTYGGETLDIADVAASLRTSDDLGNRPVIVVQAERTSDIDSRVGFEQYWRGAQRRLAELSTNSIFIVAAGSGHNIPITNPDTVSSAIALVVAAAKASQPLPACAASDLTGVGGRCDAGAGNDAAALG